MAWLVDQLLDPLVIIWLTLICMTVFHAWKRKVNSAIFSGLVVVLIFVVGSTPLADNLLGTLEQPYFRKSLKTVPVCDAVIVLGGALKKHGGSEEPLGFDASDSSDRFLTGIHLVKRGKATNLVLGGGSFGPAQNHQSESKVLSTWVESWQLTDAAVHQLGICANTREESVRVAEMVKKNNWTRLILVTSAAHMRRAYAVFQSSGVDIFPVACDFQGYPKRGSFLDRWRVLPSSGRFNKMKNYLHEKIGWLYYRSRGWIKPTT